MITYVDGDLFDSPAQVLVNTVNTVGVMGKGIALRFKRAFPKMFREYQQLCESGQLRVGHLWLYRGPERWVLNFPTKEHWRKPSRVEYIEAGLQRFCSIYASAGITSIAFPQLGCGNGELDWSTQVQPLMKRYLSDLSPDVFVHLYPSHQLPEHRTPAKMRRWLRLEVESLAFAEVWEDLTALIATRSRFETYTGQAGFDAAVDRSDAESLRLLTQDGPVEIPREALLGLWQQLRTYGYVMPRIVEAAFEPYFPYLVALFSQLPYVRPVRLASDPANLDKPESWALQWAPRPRSGQQRAEQAVQLQFV